MKKRILSCTDKVLNDKYFILLRDENKEDTYFYNEVEDFFMKRIQLNQELIKIKEDNNIFRMYQEYYLNDENYELFKIINYEYIINKINEEDLKDYTIEDFYICLDYIQKRSIHLNLKMRLYAFKF